jgi:putative ABC transport system permease protein
MTTFWSRLRSWIAAMLRRSRMESEMDAELRFHLEASAEDLVRRGVPLKEAKRQARLEFGAIDRAKEECRDALGVTFADALARDLRYGARMLHKDPGTTAIAVLTLALGIGANTAIFSAVDALLLRRLPVADPDRLVFCVTLREGVDPFGSSMLEFAAFRERAHTLARSTIAEVRSFNVVGQDEPERIQGAAVQADFLATLGVAPMLGRGITAAEDKPGGPAVALVGHNLWRRRFGGDPRLVGKALDLNGRSTTVIGILPAGVDFPDVAEIWVPLQRPLHGLPLADLAAHRFQLVARLLPGASVEQADAELRAIARDLEKEYPQVRRGWSVKVTPLRQALLSDLTGRVEKSLLALVGAVGFLLLICCANVAGLLLARGVAREREIAVRRALGATWGRVVKQLVVESLLLSALGGLGGALLAYALLPLLSALSPIQTVAFAAVLRNPHLDGRMLGILAVLTLLTGLISGLVPAWKAAGADDLLPAIQEGGQRSGAGAAGRRSLGMLVVAEVAIATALLACGGLTIRSFQRLQHLDLGFQPERLLTLHMELTSAKYREFPRRAVFVERLLQRVRQLPGVVAAGTTTDVPLTTFNPHATVYAVEGHPRANPADVPITSHRLVSPGYLEALGVVLVRGRLLREQDRAGAQPVTVISEELARQGWLGADPVGKRIKRIRPGETFPWLTVVGVVKDVKEDPFSFRSNRPVWYLPYAQEANAYPLDLVVKASGAPARLAPAIRRAVLEVDPEQPVSNVATMSALVAGELVTERFTAVLMGALAAIGLLLAIIGLYGVMAYSVRRQTGEIGLRVALGARPGDIFKMVFGRGARLIAAGLAVGLVCAVALTRLLAGTLYGVEAHDPLTFSTISLLLASVATLACWLPARRAMRVDPLVALRSD